MEGRSDKDEKLIKSKKVRKENFEVHKETLESSLNKLSKLIKQLLKAQK